MAGQVLVCPDPASGCARSRPPPRPERAYDALLGSYGIVIARSAAAKQSTVFQVKAGLKGFLAWIIALSVTMSFRMTATMMSLCGLPLALSLSRKAMEGRVMRAVAERAAMNKVSRRGLTAAGDAGAVYGRAAFAGDRGDADESGDLAAIERADFGEASEDHLSILRADAFARKAQGGWPFRSRMGSLAMRASIWLSRTSITAPIEALTLASWACARGSFRTDAGRSIGRAD